MEPNIEILKQDKHYKSSSDNTQGKGYELTG